MAGVWTFWGLLSHRAAADLWLRWLRWLLLLLLLLCMHVSCYVAGLCYELCAGIMDKPGKSPAQVCTPSYPCDMYVAHCSQCRPAQLMPLA
jgi:hypothetical protein